VKAKPIPGHRDRLCRPYLPSVRPRRAVVIRAAPSGKKVTIVTGLVTQWPDLTT
jgi:hypothetical protein